MHGQNHIKLHELPEHMLTRLKYWIF